MVTIHTTCCDTKVCAQRQSAFPCYHHANSKDPHTASTDWTPWWIRTVFSLRHDNVYKISMKSSRHRRAVSQAVGRRVLTAEAPDRSQGTTCEICDGRIGMTVGFLWRLRLAPTSIIPPALHKHLPIPVALTRKTNGRGLGTTQKPILIGNRGALI